MATPASNPDLQQLTNVIDAMTDALVVIDLGWTVTTCNQSAQKITRWLKEDLLGKQFRDCIKFIREQDRTDNYRAIEEVISTGKAEQQPDSTLLLAKDGTEIPITYTATPLFDRAGKVNGAVIVFRDLTLEKDAFRMRSDFAYMQHQLGTPLTAVMWKLQAVVGSTKEEATRQELNAVLTLLESINILSNKLIEVSSIDQGIITPLEKETTIEQIVNQALPQVSKLSKTKQAEIVVASDILAATVKTDVTYCSKILEEILKNAIQYSDSGKKVELKISRGANGVLFEIVDQGAGISLEDQQMIFTKFFRGSNLSSAVPGAGLGLYTVLRYVKLLKGKIWFVSKEGKGSSFSFFLPS